MMTNDPLILKLLLIGEGDCAGALALLRAYPAKIALVVTTPLPSASELIATYPETALYNIQQMEQIVMRSSRHSHPIPPPPFGSVVLYQIDACHLHTPEVQERLRQQLQWWLFWLQTSGSNNNNNEQDGTTDPSPENNNNDPTHPSSAAPLLLFDMVLFQYPHLGIPVPPTTASTNDDPDDDESILRQRHVSLLHHYLYSASFVAPILHVTLNVAQYESWLLISTRRPSAPSPTTTTANTTNTDTYPIWSFPDRSLQLQKVVPVQQPFHWIFPAPFHETLTPAEISTMTVRRVSKKYHGGNHRHSLSKFGYHHVRTITSSTKKLGPVSLVGSCHYVLKCPPRPPVATNDEMVATGNDTHPNDATSCPICGVSCSNVWELERHVQHPTRFPITGPCATGSTTGLLHRHNTTTTTTTHGRTVDLDHTAGTKIIINGNTDHGATIMAVDGHGTTTGTGARIIPMNIPTFRQDHNVMESIISNEDIGRRLRWFLQHARHESGVSFSKRQSERLIHNGSVSIQDEMVTDSSRILHTVGQVVRVHVPPAEHVLGTTRSSHMNNKQVGCDPQNETTTVDEPCDANTKVAIVDTHPIHLPSNHGSSLIVVWKPVGMRTIGSFTNDTLEQYLFHHNQQALCTSDGDANSTRNGHGPIISRYQFKSLSKLDKGCGGLCVVIQQQLQKQSPESSASIPIQELINFRIQHKYTALVYGNSCPPEWKTGASILLPVYGLRRWKNRKRQAPGHTNDKSRDRDQCNDINVVDDDSCWANDDDETDATISHERDDSIEMATVTVTEQTEIPPLSTISIATTSTVSGLAQTIGYYLRRNNCSIVGDRMAVQEYNTLPRAVRNRIKQRLCLGCTGVRVEMPLRHNNDTFSHQVDEQMFETKHPIPVKWSALHWQEFCSKATKLDG